LYVFGSASGESLGMGELMSVCRLTPSWLSILGLQSRSFLSRVPL
jgi:hypothetical protein